jgi:hypothetical protein
MILTDERAHWQSALIIGQGVEIGAQSLDGAGEMSAVGVSL